MADEVTTKADDAYMKSTFYEQLVEPVFISKAHQQAWHYFGKTVEVPRPEVDESGYDVNSGSIFCQYSGLIEGQTTKVASVRVKKG